MGKENREPLYIMGSLKLRNCTEYRSDSTDFSMTHQHLIWWKCEQGFVSCFVNI